MQRLDSWAELSAHRLAAPAAEEGYWKAHRSRLVAEQIKALREAKGLSQAQLAERVGTTGSMIARLEAGCITSDLDTLDRVAAALDAQLAIGFRERDPH
jgi:ribosome-binding protein aMBF1 (putative translation factor)